MTIKRETRITIRTAARRLRELIKNDTSLAKTTKAGYRSNLNLVTKFMGKKLLKDVTAYDIEEFLNEVLPNVPHSRGSGYNTKMRKNIRTILNILFVHHVKTGELRRNPFDDGVKLYAKDDLNFVLPYTKDELKALAAVADGSGVVEALLLAAREGLRPCELIALTESSYNRDTSRLQINKSMALDNMKAPKTNGSKRNLAITSRSEEVLNQMLQKPYKRDVTYHLNNNTVTEKFVFTNTEGQSWGDCKKLSLALAPYFEKAGVKPRGVAPARHSFITNSIESGMSFEETAEYVGHNNTTTIKEYYLHWKDYSRGLTSLEQRNAENTF